MLTHYTKRIDGVANILSHGFAWVANRRNVAEFLIPHHDYSNREPQQFGMISFIDMGPEEARSHLGAFGRYGIAVSDEWARHQNARRVVSVDSDGPVTEALQAIFEIGYRDCEARIRFPEDAGWTMAFENKVAPKRRQNGSQCILRSRRRAMNIKYFQDTDTLYIEFRKDAVAETRDLDEDTLLDLDAAGNIVATTVEHAWQRADIPHFSFEQVAP